MEFEHKPVLLRECLEGLDIKADGIYFDGTVGGAGHSREIAARLDAAKGGRLICADRDPEAVAVSRERLEGLPAEVFEGNYDEIASILARAAADRVNGILLDLGVSSYQLDNAERGFSYHSDAPLDMRMSSSGLSARDVVNGYDYKSLVRVLYEYGEEKFAPRIAQAIVNRREQAPVETTGELADIVREAVPQKARRDKNPCKKTFQAIRIEVNDEFGHLDRALDSCFDALAEGGRLCVITFHSLEDRIVKQRFRRFCQGCVCPPDFPQCVCGRTPSARLVSRKPLEACDDELAQNPRSRSAKLRVLEKIKERYPD